MLQTKDVVARAGPVRAIVPAAKMVLEVGLVETGGERLFIKFSDAVRLRGSLGGALVDGLGPVTLGARLRAL